MAKHDPKIIKASLLNILLHQKFVISGGLVQATESTSSTDSITTTAKSPATSTTEMYTTTTGISF